MEGEEVRRRGGAEEQERRRTSPERRWRWRGGAHVDNGTAARWLPVTREAWPLIVDRAPALGARRRQTRDGTVSRVCAHV